MPSSSTFLSTSGDTFFPGEHAMADYGNLADLNCGGVILESVGKDALRDLAEEYLQPLATSLAIVERDGDYALRLHSSPWCVLLDGASRKLCGVEDNAMAINSGRWLCHESCQAACRRAMAEISPGDFSCAGGLFLHAAPVVADEEVVGAMVFSYGEPPVDLNSLTTLAARFQVSIEDLRAAGLAGRPAPAYVVEMAKKRLRNTVRLIELTVAHKRLEQRLKRSEELYNLVLNHSSQSILMIQDGFITLANARAEHGSGYAASEIVGHPLHRFIHPQDQDMVLANFVKRLSGESVADYAFRFIDRSGTVKWVEVGGVVFPWDERPASLIFLTDITERKRAEEALLLADRLRDR